MLEILQWLGLLMLGGCAGWFWKNHSTHRIPEWLEGIDEEDLVRQSDLDQYHHRVVQLSHAQRELLLKRVDALERRLNRYEGGSNPAQAPQVPIVDSSGPAESDREVSPGLPDSATTPDAPVDSEPTREADAPVADSSEPSEDPFDPTNRVMALWRDGKPVEEIARELRMGRQEVQLLIEMSRHTLAASRR